MECIEIAKMTSKGQITVPSMIREILKLKQGSTVMFKVTRNGVLIMPCEIKEKNLYTSKEWRKIEKVVAEKGKIYTSAYQAKKHLKKL
jgi:AbrB family looped-hinge helix DNA binding protein